MLLSTSHFLGCIPFRAPQRSEKSSRSFITLSEQSEVIGLLKLVTNACLKALFTMVPMRKLKKGTAMNLEISLCFVLDGAISLSVALS